MARKGLAHLFNRKPMNGKPIIAEVTPRAAIPGGEVMIRGSGFGPANHSRPRVNFGDVEAPVVVCAESFVVARVPEGATSGRLIVFSMR